MHHKNGIMGWKYLQVLKRGMDTNGCHQLCAHRECGSQLTHLQLLLRLKGTKQMNHTIPIGQFGLL